MPRPLPRPAKVTKSRHSRIRESIPRKGNPISPVMQKLRGLLPAHKPARHLALLIDAPLPHCQKLLCGERRENSEILTALLRSAHGREVLFALMGEARPDWFARYSRQLDLNAARRQLEENRRAIEALQTEMAE